MSKVESVKVRGASGKTYTFDVYPWGTTFKAVGAVYLVLKKNQSNYSILYIGQTGDLSERFDDHHKASCFTRHGRTHIGILVESSETRRLAIEADLIANYKPVCNG